jgi:hypothetical protein
MSFANRICEEWDLSVFLFVFLLLLLLLLLQCWLWRCYLLRSPGFSNTFSWRRARLARRNLGGGGRTRPTNLRMDWSKGGMGIAITLCDETKYERRKDKHDNSLFGRGEAQSLPDLIEFETHSVFQPQINTNGDEFIKSRNLNEETGLTLQHFNASTRRSIRHLCHSFGIRNSCFVVLVISQVASRHRYRAAA